MNGRHVTRWTIACMVAIVALGTAMPSVAPAQIAPGAFELAATGGYHSIGRYDIGILSVVGGYSIGREHQVGAGLTTNFINQDRSSQLTGFYSYHLNAEHSVIPFLTAGAGLGDGMPVPGLIIDPRLVGSNFSDVHIAFGGGLKAFVAGPAAFRIEYRYNLVWTDVEDFQTFDRHSVLFGFSLFFDWWAESGKKSGI